MTSCRGVQDPGDYPFLDEILHYLFCLFFTELWYPICVHVLAQCCPSLLVVLHLSFCTALAICSLYFRFWPPSSLSLMQAILRWPVLLHVLHSTVLATLLQSLVAWASFAQQKHLPCSCRGMLEFCLLSQFLAMAVISTQSSSSLLLLSVLNRAVQQANLCNHLRVLHVTQCTLEGVSSHPSHVGCKIFLFARLTWSRGPCAS